MVAAREEIIAHGAAGARMDRIARLALTSKERIYFYFRNKADLVAAVAAEHAVGFEHGIRFDEDNVLGFVGALFDFYCRESDEVRLWLRLLLDVGEEELPEDDPRVRLLSERVQAVRRAQAKGTIDPAWDPIMLLNLLSSLTASWAIVPAFVHQLRDRGSGPESRERHRKAVLDIADRFLRNAPRID